ncbi:hypothetical protein P7B04_23095 [Sphingobium yanoikuyae]|uniref:hypothetical protein n=1 Tax=Sphingobium yanoikuyae TaxID=13690 RepID=UPI00147FB119|nr:hypothetical protein [Sphingobium yanoikuyae]MDG2515563.1 hypothetical protein [Sphingobium yanoikuyae]
MQDHLNAAGEVADLTDQQLVELWIAVPDPEQLTPVEQAVIDEMERRGIDF